MPCSASYAFVPNGSPSKLELDQQSVEHGVPGQQESPQASHRRSHAVVKLTVSSSGWPVKVESATTRSVGAEFSKADMKFASRSRTPCALTFAATKQLTISPKHIILLERENFIRTSLLSMVQLLSYAIVPVRYVFRCQSG